MKQQRPTSLDIAALAGVSQTTVSRALAQSPLVSEDAKRRVLEAAKALRYKVDVNARKLRSKKIHTLAVLISEDLDNSENPINPFFLPLIGSILKYAGQQGYDVLISLQQKSDEWGTDYGFSRRADGIIFLGCKDFQVYTHLFEYLNEVGDPWVVWGVNRLDCARLVIGSDNEAGGYLATRHLLDLGRRRIAFIGKYQAEHPEFRDRYRGYCRALTEAGIAVDDALRVDAFLAREEGVAGVDRLLDNNIPFDAVFCATDLLAMGAMQELHKRGLHVPNDVSVVGFDDLWVCSSLSPALTTIRQDTEAAARALIDGLSSLIEDEPVVDTQMAPKLVIRESCGGLPNLMAAQ
ncbi:LacI family transcriptional regulator [Asticcacaulis sp. AC460]|uniref:LacI family DNA-binding transcriptional regulator n=1 Tax=Asticcacaulis sp. AC460 TaxID=1282360 RepID=UPI0003C3BE6B|nr:LacI family DNA-binding transcriptional regulator [Asticcacaulis sp. AC460]ESQ91561.1 LacI family transcriptional regulator [Asticcacaulis sp. AC460]